MAWKRIHASALAVIGEIELFYRLDRFSNGQLGHPILAVTGTDGKTTTVSLLAEICRAAGLEVALAGNIGDPLCGLVDRLPQGAVVVAEVSAFQLITAPMFRPRVAVITNIAEDHVDYFGGDFEAYAEAKLKLARPCLPGDTYIYNGADERLVSFAAQLQSGCALVPFSARRALERGAIRRDDELLWLDGDSQVVFASVNELGQDAGRPWGGVHNHDNALAASMAALAFGLRPEHIRLGLRRYATPPHRCEPAGHSGDVRFVNVSKATNPHAALAGVRGTELRAGERLVWIGGGSEKQSDFSDLAREVGQRADVAVVCGATAARIASAFDEVSAPCEVLETADLHSAIALEWHHAQPQGCVLFSPACASFDSFKSYAHRGEAFKEAVAPRRRSEPAGH